MFELDIKYSGENKQINPNYQFIPFAQRGSGDRYCFWYEKGQTEPGIIMYEHDTGEAQLWAKDFEEFIYIQFVIDIAEGEEGLDSNYTKLHIKWLNEDYQKLLSEKPAEELAKELPDPELIDIYVKIECQSDFKENESV